jgi:hypothetical protein
MLSEKVESLGLVFLFLHVDVYLKWQSASNSRNDATSRLYIVKDVHSTPKKLTRENKLLIVVIIPIDNLYFFTQNF